MSANLPHGHGGPARRRVRSAAGDICRSLERNGIPQVGIAFVLAHDSVAKVRYRALEAMAYRKHVFVLSEALREALYKERDRVVRREMVRAAIDLMFQLTTKEFEALRSQFVTSKPGGRGGRRSNPYAFTEQGVAMLSSVLRSPRAIRVNAEIMRAFVRLRRMLQENVELGRKLAGLERKYDGQFRIVFDAIRELMAPPAKSRRQIGFGVDKR